MESDSHSNACPAKPAGAGEKGAPLAGSLTFQNLVSIIGWACFAVSTILWLVLVVPHLRQYRVPNEQRQIFKIVSTPLIFAIVAVISTHTYHAADYLEPLANLYEGFALASLFLLYVQYVTPDVTTRDAFFQSLEKKGKKGSVTPGGSLRWFWNTWRTVFFYVVIYTVLVIIQEITKATGAYCSTSSRPRFANIWRWQIQALELGTTIWAILAVIRFQRRLREFMNGKRAVAKLVMFKLFVVITTIQRVSLSLRPVNRNHLTAVQFIFGILRSKVTGGSKVTYDDITIGLPALLNCVEALMFMVGNYFIFNIREYRTGQEKDGPRSRIRKSLPDALNPMDLIRAIGLAFGSLRSRRSSQR
ncbi:seven transmembrane receptor protein [Cladophialophora carrionii]|uniref:Seven transmembrane receptor protein n=1 Tax=Cladophialophora carrionii TaxID=86049 RepID=A0A1C1CLV2_9EURO|nr:seven transmembrane receptor protein [Cladophialophora carrionii]